MKSAAHKSAEKYIFWVSLAALLFLASVVAGGVLAQSEVSQSGQNAASAQGSQMDSSRPVLPNYTLAERFVPSAVSKLVFDMDVTPHWFELSDRFWYSYETPEGTRYWVVDPAKRTKTPLFDNAKVAAQLVDAHELSL